MSPESVLRSPINYKMEVKRAVVKAFQAVFHNENEYYPGYKSSELLTKSHITIEYPQRPEQYPSLIVGFQESELKSAGIGHLDTYGDGTVAQKWLFFGKITVEIFALTSMDRDFISDSVVNMLSFGRVMGIPFRRMIEQESRVDLQLSVGSLEPVAEQTMSGASWGLTDQRIYTVGYNFGCMGGFDSGVITYDYLSGIEIDTRYVGGQFQDVNVSIPPKPTE
jgi:hypothetical protein